MSTFKKKKMHLLSKGEIILGVTIDIAKKHIERQFKKGMTWNNRGLKSDQWQIDHIIPLASAKNEEEVIKLCHYTNLQPLWAPENSSKNASIIETQITLNL